MAIDIAATKTVVEALDLNGAILANQAIIRKQFAEIENEVAADKFHEENAVRRINDEIIAQDLTVHDGSFHIYQVIGSG